MIGDWFVLALSATLDVLEAPAFWYCVTAVLCAMILGRAVSRAKQK